MALRVGATHEQVHTSCRYDPWFIARLQEIVDANIELRRLMLERDSAQPQHDVLTPQPAPTKPPVGEPQRDGA